MDEPVEHSETLGLRLLLLRTARRLSLREVRHLTGISASTLSRFERDAQAPSLEQLGTLARFYGVTPHDLLGWKPYRHADGSQEFAA